MKRYVKASITKVNGVSIDMWYGDDIADIDDVDVRFYPNDGEYRGNLYIGRKCVGDFSAKDSVALEKVFPQIYWDALHNVPDSYWNNSNDVESSTDIKADSYARYRVPIGPEESDMDWVVKGIAKHIEYLKKKYNTDEVTTEDIIEGFRSLNDDYDDWWARSLSRDDAKEHAFVYDLIDRLKAYGIDNVVDNTYVTSSTDIKASRSVDYIGEQLANETDKKSIKDAYNRGYFDIVVMDGNVYYVESSGCPDRTYRLIEKEMHRLHPELTYLYADQFYEDMDSRHQSVKSAYELDPEKENFYRDYPSKDSDEYMDMGTGLFYWYFTRHGVGPGSVPRGLNIIDIIDTPQGSYFLTDRVLTTKSLNYYDIKEKAPEGVE